MLIQIVQVTIGFLFTIFILAGTIIILYVMTATAANAPITPGAAVVLYWAFLFGALALWYLNMWTFFARVKRTDLQLHDSLAQGKSFVAAQATLSGANWMRVAMRARDISRFSGFPVSIRRHAHFTWCLTTALLVAWLAAIPITFASAWLFP